MVSAWATAIEPRLLILILAIGVDALIGDPPALWRQVPHPVTVIGRLITLLDNRLNRETRSFNTRRVRGVITLVALVFLSAYLGFIIHDLAVHLKQVLLIETILVAILIAQRSLYDHVLRVMQALQHDGLVAGRSAVSHIVGRDPNSLDIYGVARAGIESLAENFSDGVIAPILAYAVAGLPGLFVYKTVNTLDSMIGHKNPRYLAFGWASARFDDLLNLVPARITGLLLVMAACFVPHAAPGRALLTMMRDAPKHRSPNAGWPEAAMAGALGLALAGPRRYGLDVVDDAWMGDGRAKATHQDIKRSLFLYGVAALIMVLVLALGMILLVF